MKYSFKNSALIFFAFSTVVISNRCGSPNERKGNIKSSPFTTDIKYEVIKTDNRDPIINLYVYTTDTARVAELNKLLLGEWSPNNDKFIDIAYFDDKKCAGEFDKILDESVISKKEMKNIDRHSIYRYSYNPKSKEEINGRVYNGDIPESHTK